MKYTMILKM